MNSTNALKGENPIKCQCHSFETHVLYESLSLIYSYWFMDCFQRTFP